MEENFYKNNIDLSERQSRQTVTIADTLLEKGLLRNYTGDECKILLYLFTHRRKENIVEIEIPLAAAALGLEIKKLKKSLHSLNNKGVLKSKQNKSSEVLNYKLELNNLMTELTDEEELENYEEVSAKELRRRVIKSQALSKSEIAAALISFLPPDNRNIHRREEIKGWLDDFELKMLKELIRRVDKWLQREGGGDYMVGSFSYLRKIVQSWYEEEITNYEKLQQQDKLYRETRELAKAYGINAFSSNTAQLKTFQNWLSGHQALSKELALAAIREAVRRKRDGQPSLKYIEDNFINPIKELKINNLADFKRWLQKEMDNNSLKADQREKNTADQTEAEQKKDKNKKSKEQSKNNQDDYKWKDFFIDFDKYKE
ncbi:DnaD domain protein [Halanaerobium hydrogeniformans]|uniref:Primosome, DnaD subunit n=1 Tax=Halanaerobium hydrogeniformans TaxID=656519 RepID=E4RL72_HALHG|nr:DnaD domain protein [Halanaerobium hydrogeniformans]ADQ15753.1 primosome, DnaD subunit [Halanaerobium hydrogeniformans]